MASGPIPLWQIDVETVETMTDFIFLGSEINADGDCNHTSLPSLPSTPTGSHPSTPTGRPSLLTHYLNLYLGITSSKKFSLISLSFN